MRPVMGFFRKSPRFWFTAALVWIESFLSRDDYTLFANALVGPASKRSRFASSSLWPRRTNFASFMLGSANEPPVVNDGNAARNDWFSVDPLIYSVLEDQESSSLELLGGILEASAGISVWRQAFSKGRLPLESEFSVTTMGEVAWWPCQPLFSKLYESMVTLQLPRFALRHPEAITVIILSILRLTIEYSKTMRSLRQEKITKDSEVNDVEEEEDIYFLEWQKQYQLESDAKSHQLPLLETADDEETIAEQAARGLLDEWSGVLKGVNILDSLFGSDHGLLQLSQDAADNSGGGATVGFGVHDGIWSHTGWKEIPILQRELSNEAGLQELVNSLGRRPSAKDSDRMQRFPPRKRQEDGALGAEFDAQLRESVEGITLSGSFSEMLPSEALLLCGKSKALRRLFLARKVESKLLSYQLSGWNDVPSVPRTRSLYKNRLPSAPGGPIIVCLDTSWSMTGRRESLSKAVVLSFVSLAHKQGRDCQVVAFSTEKGVIEAGVITADSTDGIKRLLEFLSCSFGGGTDVTGALKYAITSLEDDRMSSADILLVTDGEIPDPPVSDEMMETLDLWKLKKGTQVHGLLIGKSESKPLSRICTATHDFLSANDLPVRASGSSLVFARSARFGTALYAKRSSYNEEQGSDSRQKGDRKFYDDSSLFEDGDSTSWSEDRKDGFTTDAVTFPVAVINRVELLRKSAAQAVSQASWSPEILVQERAQHAGCWQTHLQLRAAIERVEDGLVERAEDARLVVLAMVAQEHILLLGSPGTGKSILGARLAELCEGRFFQRLLTRFTTPEELFGPLSLRSLERDEYRRCTEGFLPTADVAFLDEIFKANSAILNTLLTILNERKFDNAGGRESCPIRCVVGASNELPENDELVALFDRFLIRKEVLPVTDNGVLDLLSMSNPGQPSCKTNAGEAFCENVFADGFDEVVNSLASTAESITLEKYACELMRDLRTYMRQELNVEISDRRLVKAARLVKISAASDGREKVDPIDFLLLQHCFWDLPEQRIQIREWLWENLTPCDGSQGSSVEQFRFLLDNLRNEIIAVLRKTTGDVTGDFGARPDDLLVIDALLAECNRMSALLQQHLNSIARHMETIRRSDEFLWIDPEDANAIKQMLLPRSESLWAELQKLCEDARALALSLSTLPEAPSNELRLDVIQELWEAGFKGEIDFTEADLSIRMKEAKSKYDLETFRRWKRALKKMDKS